MFRYNQYLLTLPICTGMICEHFIYLTLSIESFLRNLSDHLSSPPVFSGVRVARSLVFCVVFCKSLFILFLLAIVLSVLITRITDSGYPFCIFKLFLNH